MIFPLCVLFLVFESETMRLKLLNRALEIFDERTRTTPTGEADEIFQDPFRLHDASNVPFDLANEENMMQWRKRFHVLTNNLDQWTQCESILRIFSSTSR